MQPLQRAASSALDAVGLPSPEGADERVIGDATRMMAGGGGLAGAAGKAATMLSGAPKAVASALGASPVMQGIAGAGAGAAGGSVREAGGGDLAQFGAALLGGVAGAMDGGDKTQSTNRDPWAPAQDFLKQQIGQGQQLSQQYQAQPFSGAQKAGYNNMAGLLDLVNNNAGGLLSGFQANASGANQFSRADPRRGLLGSTFNPSTQEWNPQTYGRFGG
jgi:hypothetical protein